MKRFCPRLGYPELYGVTVTSAAGAVSIASFWVLLGTGFDNRGYLSVVRVGRDAVWVIANALLAAAVLVVVVTATGVVDESMRSGEAFVAAGPRLVVTDGGVSVFYRCNRTRFGR